MTRKRRTRSRRANGEGSLYQLSDGRWCFAFKFEGESKTRYFTGKTAEEATRKKDEALKTLHQKGFLPTTNNLTVGEWMIFWLENYKVSDLTENGYDSYKREIEIWINPHIGDLLLSGLRSLDVQQWVNRQVKSGRKDGKGGLAPKTVVRTFGILRQALDKAVEEELILANPAGKNRAGKSLINLPKIPKPQIRHMSIEEVPIFLEAIKDDYMYPAIITSLMSGLRRGELLGLKWKDIDFEEGSILVRRQLVRKASGECEIVERLKTEAGYREVQIPSNLLALLDEHKKNQLAIKLELAGEENEKVVSIKRKKDTQDEDLVFCWPDGRWYNPDHFYRRLQRLLKKHGFERLTVHELRHTYATSSLALGTDISVLSKNLGHTDIATTAIYLHSDTEREKAAAAKLGKAFTNTNTNRTTNKS